MKAITCLWTALVFSAAGAAALAGDGFQPPTDENSTDWIALAVAAVAAIAVCVLAFKNAKRTHLD